MEKNGKFCSMWEAFVLYMFILTGSAAGIVLKSIDKTAEWIRTTALSARQYFAVFSKMSQTVLICKLHAFTKNETLHNASDKPAVTTACTLAHADTGSPVHYSEHRLQLGLGAPLLVLSQIMA